MHPNNEDADMTNIDMFNDNITFGFGFKDYLQPSIGSIRFTYNSAMNDSISTKEIPT